MCTVSFVGDYYGDKWRMLPYVQPPNMTTIIQPSQITREEFDALRRDVLEMKELLKKAKDIDAALGTPDCEMDEKVALLRKVAELVGVDLDDILIPRPTSFLGEGIRG